MRYLIGVFGALVVQSCGPPIGQWGRVALRREVQSGMSDLSTGGPGEVAWLDRIEEVLQNAQETASSTLSFPQFGQVVTGRI